MNPCARQIAIGTESYSAEWLLSTHAGQLLLKENHSSEQRPRCMCQPSGVEMYIGRRGSVYYLSRMPGSGFLHADACASVEDISLLSGALSYAPGAIIEGSDGSLRLMANLDRRERQVAPITEVSIDGVLDILVEQADLNRLQPSAEPRSWTIVREQLLGASQTIFLQDDSLVTNLFVPPRYVRDTYKLASCEEKIRSQSQTLILAPLKELRPTTYGWQVVLKHLPGLRLWASKDASEQMEARWASPYFRVNPEYALCLVAARPGRRDGNYTVTNMAILPTDANFFPCRSLREVEVAADLIAHGLPILRPLRFDSFPIQVLADFAVLDGKSPTPVFVLSSTGTAEFDDAKRCLATLMERNHASVSVYL